MDGITNFSPAWSEIPDKPDWVDFERQLAYMKGEMLEVEEATTGNERSLKKFAHIAEEVADVMLAGWTMLKLMERMDDCPTDDFANKTMLFCHLKNNRRGYHNDKKRV